MVRTEKIPEISPFIDPSTEVGDQPPVRLGLPKGRLEDGVVRLLTDAGIEVSLEPRGYRARIGVPGFSAKRLKPQNIVEMLGQGSRDLGFAGADWVAELADEHVRGFHIAMDHPA